MNRRERAHEIRQRSQAIIRQAREAEDWALLVLGDPALAARFREVYECVTERIIYGRYGEGLSRAKLNDIAEWIDRWAWENLPRRHEYDSRIDEGPHHIGPHRVDQAFIDQVADRIVKDHGETLRKLDDE